MKKIFALLFLVLFMPSARAEWNPFTGEYENQILFDVGQGVNGGFIIAPPSQFVPFYIFHLQYSQPTTFFRLPARQSINIAQTVGMGSRYGWKWQDFSIPIGYLSEDIALLCWNDLYFAAGAGVGLQVQQNDRIGSKLLFQFKLSLGYHITDRIGTELYMQHFSNANTDRDNHSYAFYGAAITYNF